MWNLCYFCDISLLLTTIVFWIPLEYKSNIASTSALLACLPCIAWTIDYIFLSIGISSFDIATYMYDPKYSIGMRFLSLFHVWLWLVHLYLLSKYSYDIKSYQTFLKIVFCVYLCLESFEPHQPPNINNYVNPFYKYFYVIMIYFMHKLFSLFFINKYL